MEVMVAVHSGTLLHALRVQLKRRVSARRGGDYFFLVFDLKFSIPLLRDVLFPISRYPPATEADSVSRDAQNKPSSPSLVNTPKNKERQVHSSNRGT